jgi:ParB-like nuclease domain
MQKRHLGRGLSALFGGDDTEAPAGAQGATPVAATRTAPIEFLHPSAMQPRTSFDEDKLDQLAQSIREQGVLQPILVREHRTKQGEWEIVAGERRWRAAQKAQLHDVPIVVRDLSDRDTLEIALIENVQRQDLNPIEEARGYRRLMQEQKKAKRFKQPKAPREKDADSWSATSPPSSASRPRSPSTARAARSRALQYPRLIAALGQEGWIRFRRQSTQSPLTPRSSVASIRRRPDSNRASLSSGS